MIYKGDRHGASTELTCAIYYYSAMMSYVSSDISAKTGMISDPFLGLFLSTYCVALYQSTKLLYAGPARIITVRYVVKLPRPSTLRGTVIECQLSG